MFPLTYLRLARRQLQTYFLYSAELSIKVLDVVAVRVTGFLAESGDLLSHIGDAASCALLEEVEISYDRAVVEPMVEEGI